MACWVFRPGAPGRRTRRSAPTRPCASSFPRRAARTGASADRGRHFPAMEAPGQFAARLQAFFAPPQNRCPALRPAQPRTRISGRRDRAPARAAHLKAADSHPCRISLAAQNVRYGTARDDGGRNRIAEHSGGSARGYCRLITSSARHLSWVSTARWLRGPNIYTGHTVPRTPGHAADRAMTCVIRRCLGRGHDAVLSMQ